MTRRNFIHTSLTAAALAAVGSVPRSLRAAAPSAGTIPLRFPPNHTGSSLLARATSVDVWPGAPVEAWTYGDVFPGPTVHLRKGERFEIDLTNELPQETTIHWHGLLVPPGMDGQPTEPVAPSSTFRYEFDVLNRAGLYFYHPHPHGQTGGQVYRGLSGLVIVTDDEAEALNLPRAYFDLPLLIQDRSSTDTQRFEYEPSARQVLNGVLGDIILVNGTPDAFALADAGSYRLRIANGSNARILKLGFADSRRFHVIGTDGGLLDAPAAASSVFLGPGERIDIMVDFSDLLEAGSTMLMSLPFGGATEATQQGFGMPVLVFVGTGLEGYLGRVPEVLAELHRYDPADAARTRRFELQTMPVPMSGHYHRINGLTYEPGRIDWRVPFGELELWEIVNTHTMPHPMHVHGAQFQVLDRDGNTTLAPEDRGWKDTVTVWGQQTVRILIRFDQHDGTYLFHCHNLEHEDEGMMLTFAVERSTSVDVDVLPSMLDLR